MTREQLAAGRGRARPASSGSPRCCRRAPPRGCPSRPGRPCWRPRTGCCAASGRSWASLRTDLEQPDWFRDPVTGRRSDPDRYAFRIDHRSEEQTGNVKQVWEISRLQHLTLLAAAWALSHDERYASRVADQLRSWWQENPFLSGVHWTSGIELGIRLISLAWIRRLLDDWPGVGDLFERNGARGPADPLAPAVPGRVPQPRLLGQQPRDRRGRRAAGGELRVPVVRRERPVAARRPPGCWSASCCATPSRPASTASWLPTTTASSPSSGSWPPSRPRPAATR